MSPLSFFFFSSKRTDTKSLLVSVGPECLKGDAKEGFGPFQIIVVYEDKDMKIVKKTLENISQNLTAAIVSNDILFQQEILASTVNGTTYSGMKARTTGAPQNHWFGPSGDPRSAGIGTPEAIISTWSSHREIIKDVGPL